MDFWSRLARLNAPVLAAGLRTLATEVERLWPGQAAFACPVIFEHEGVMQMGEITVKDDSAPLGATVTFLDAKGAETQPDETPQWSSSDETVAAVTADDDGMAASVTVGTPGAAVITVTTTDADGTEVTSQGTVTVQPGEAVIGDVEFQAPA